MPGSFSAPANTGTATSLSVRTRRWQRDGSTGAAFNQSPTPTPAASQPSSRCEASALCYNALVGAPRARGCDRGGPAARVTTQWSRGTRLGHSLSQSGAATAQCGWRRGQALPAHDGGSPTCSGTRCCCSQQNALQRLAFLRRELAGHRVEASQLSDGVGGVAIVLRPALFRSATSVEFFVLDAGFVAKPIVGVGRGPGSRPPGLACSPAQSCPTTGR